ncbi:DUF1385 domain-containing protein [soil metagenome]
MAAAPSQAPPSIGGQAVLEGVMMRGPASWSVACRKPDSTVAVEVHELPAFAERHRWARRPLARGCVVLGESLVIGMRALKISARYAMEEADGEDESDKPMTDRQLGMTLAIAMVVFSAVFIALPVLATRLIEALSGNAIVDRPLLFNLIEGAMRIGLFVGYLLLISRLDDIRRVFQYHGAEHKTIYAYENGDRLVPEEIDRKYSTLHVRCGTNFLFIVLFLTIVAHFVIDLLVGGPLVPRIGVRMLAIPLLAGVSYEAIRLASRREESVTFKVLMLPGLALQKITTKPPSLEQIEVAIAAMEAVDPAKDAGRRAAASGSPETPVA